MESAESNQNETNSPKKNNERTLWCQVDDFKKCAKIYRLWAKIYICFIVLIISAAIIIYNFAPYITGIELQELIMGAGSSIANQQEDFLENLNRDLTEISNEFNRDTTITGLDDRYKSISLQSLDDKIKNLVSELKNEQEKMLEILSEEMKSEFDIPALIQLNITRLGTVGIFAFIVVLFTGIYRNNVRLAVFYDSRASALEYILISNNPDLIPNPIDFMEPEVYFGKMPQTPIEQISEIVKQNTNGNKK